MTTPVAELNTALRAIAHVRDRLARSDPASALELIDAAQLNLERSLTATEAAQHQLEQAKAALAGDFYTAPTDRTVRPKPAPLALGPAGFHFTDPTFGSPLIRATDDQTAAGASLRVPSNSHLAAWNTDGSRFYAVTEHGNAVIFAFDGTTVTRLPVETGSYIEPAFSYVDPQTLWCVGGANQRTVYTSDLASGQSVVVCDLDRRYPELHLSGYCGSVLTTDADVWCIFFGGQGQDDHRYIHHSNAGLLDVVQRCGVKIHATSMDRPGRYVLIYSTNADIQAGKAQVIIWDTQTGALTPVTHLAGGHDCLGYGVWINQDCCSGTVWDGMQWQYRELATPTQTRDLIIPTLEPHEAYISEHSTWRNGTPDNAAPFVSITYRRDVPGQPVAPWRAWDDEVICVSTDGQSVVHRFCHHQSDSAGEFWAQPIGNVSPDGRWALFTSNWGKTLPGTRQDVFLVHLL